MLWDKAFCSFSQKNNKNKVAPLFTIQLIKTFFKLFCHLKDILKDRENIKADIKVTIYSIAKTSFMSFKEH